MDAVLTIIEVKQDEVTHSVRFELKKMTPGALYKIVCSDDEDHMSEYVHVTDVPYVELVGTSELLSITDLDPEKPYYSFCVGSGGAKCPGQYLDVDGTLLCSWEVFTLLIL